MQNAVITRWELLDEDKFQTLLIQIAQYLSMALPVESGIEICRDCVQCWDYCQNISAGDRFKYAPDFCDKAGYNWDEFKSMVEERYNTMIGCEVGIVTIVESGIL